MNAIHVPFANICDGKYINNPVVSWRLWVNGWMDCEGAFTLRSSLSLGDDIVILGYDRSAIWMIEDLWWAKCRQQGGQVGLYLWYMHVYRAFILSLIKIVFSISMLFWLSVKIQPAGNISFLCRIWVSLSLAGLQDFFHFFIMSASFNPSILVGIYWNVCTK